jgi:hypothetical protein
MKMTHHRFPCGIGMAKRVDEVGEEAAQVEVAVEVLAEVVPSVLAPHAADGVRPLSFCSSSN